MYNKLFEKILDSSIWLEPTATRIVWLTFIAVMDDMGFVQFASVANVAHRARVTVDEAQAAVTCLESPDQNSSDPEHEGRRVERVPGGWMVLNAGKHREIVTREVQRTQTRERVRRFRERVRQDVTLGNGERQDGNGDVTPSEAETEAAVQANSERETGTLTRAPVVVKQSGGNEGDCAMLFDWFQDRWKARYGHEAALFIKPTEHSKMGDAVRALGVEKMKQAIAAFVNSNTKTLVDKRHPLGFFLAAPGQYLVADTATATQESGFAKRMRERREAGA